MKRKQLLWIVPLAALILAAACSRQEPPAAPATPAPSGEIVFYDWAEDMPQSVLAAFTKISGITVRYETYESQEEAVEQIRKGGTYDVVVIEHDFIPALVAEGRLSEINFRNVPNFKNISPNFRDLATDPGNRHTVPYHFGTTGLIVRTDLAGRPVKRWKDLFDARFAGKIAMRPEYRELCGLTLLSLGYPLSSEDPKHLDAALPWLDALKRSSVLIDVEAAKAVPRLLSGESVILVGWAEDYRVARSKNDSVAYVVPEEGTVLWGDNYVIPGNSRNTGGAELLIDFLLRAEISAQIVNEKYYGTANEAALPFVKAELRRDPAIYPPAEVLKRAHFFRPLSPEGEKLYDTLYGRLGASRKNADEGRP